MRKLITANIIRLFKTSYFRIAAVIMASIGVFEIIMVYCDFRFENGSPFFDGPLTSVVLIPVLAIAAVVSLFVGSEYSDGTMRNKIIAGHSGVSVCLSLLLVQFIIRSVVRKKQVDIPLYDITCIRVLLIDRF